MLKYQLSFSYPRHWTQESLCIGEFAIMEHQSIVFSQVFLPPNHSFILAEFNLAEVNRNHQRSRRSFPIWLTSKHSSSGGYHNSRELFEFRHIMRSGSSSRNLNLVVVAFEKSRLVEIESLHGVVCSYAWRECGLQAPPDFALFLPGLDFFRLNTGKSKEKWCVQVRPHGVSSE